MTVVGVGQVEFGSEVFVSRHEGIGKVPVHDRAGPVEHIRVYIGPVGEKVAFPFRMDVGAPQWSEEVTVSETQQQVAKAGRIESIGVEQRRQASHYLLKSELLVESGQFVECLAPAGFRLVAVSKDVLDADATV